MIFTAKYKNIFDNEKYISEAQSKGTGSFCHFLFQLGIKCLENLTH